MEKASMSPPQLIEGDDPLPDLEMEPEMHLSYLVLEMLAL
jgi:hypothetical protein